MIIEKDGNAEAVGQRFHLADDFVIPGIAVLVGAELADFLQRVHDDEFYGRVLKEKSRDLFFEASAHEFGFGGEPEIAGFAAGDFCHAGLDAPLGIFEADVEHVALSGFEFPHILAETNSVSEPEHQPRLSNLGRTGEQIHTAPDKAVDERTGVFKLLIHQLVSTDDFQSCDFDL